MPRKNKEEGASTESAASLGRSLEHDDRQEIEIIGFPAAELPDDVKLSMVGSLSIPSLAKRWQINPGEEGILEVINVLLLFRVPLWGGRETLESYLIKESRRPSVPGLPDTLTERAFQVARVFLDDVLKFEREHPEVIASLQGKEFKPAEANVIKDKAVFLYQVLAISSPGISAKAVWESDAMFELVHKPHRGKRDRATIGSPTTFYDWLTAEGINYKERTRAKKMD